MPVGQRNTPQTEPLEGLDRQGKVQLTTISATWIGVVLAALLGIVFLVFIAQNSEQVAIQFLGFDGRLSLAVALLLAAMIGILVVAVPSAARIIQLRHALKKNARHERAHPDAP